MCDYSLTNSRCGAEYVSIKAYVAKKCKCCSGNIYKSAYSKDHKVPYTMDILGNREEAQSQKVLTFLPEQNVQKM